MLTTLMKLRPYMPRRSQKRLEDCFWKLHWKKEELRTRLFDREDIPALRGSERAVFAEHLAGLWPVESCLEVGCAFGQNFDVLAPLFPKTRFVGVDSEPQCIKVGQDMLLEKGIKNVELYQGDGANLLQFEAQSFDVTAAVACLLYVGPEKIDQVISEMLRVTKRRLMLLELHKENPYFSGQDYGTLVPRIGAGGYWVRDYALLLSRFVDPNRISLLPIARPLWDTEDWAVLGRLILVNVEDDSRD